MSCCFIFNYQNFREKIALSLIYKKKIRIDQIRNHENIPGIKNYEVDILCLAEKMITGSIIKINENGTLLDFFPGNFENFKIYHTTTSFRSLSYYIEFIIYLNFNSTKNKEIKLSGIRSTSIDISLENILYVTIPLIRKLGLRDVRFKVCSARFSYLNNTEIIFLFTKIYTKKDFKLVNLGLVNRIRIVNTYCGEIKNTKENIEIFIEKYFKRLEFDIKIFDLKIINRNFNLQTITIIIETTEGCLFGEDITFVMKKSIHVNWDKLLTKIFISLFEDINTNTCIDKKSHIILFLKMLHNGKVNNSIICIGKLTFSDIAFFRDLKKLCGIVFSIKYYSSVKFFLIKLVS